MKLLIRLADIIYALKSYLSAVFTKKKRYKAGLEYIASLACSGAVHNLVESMDRDCICLVELNTFHTETLCAIPQYFTHLGYDIDIIVREELENLIAISRQDFMLLSKPHKEQNLRLFTMSLGDMIATINSPQMKRYDFVFFNTMLLLTPQSLVHIKDFIEVKSKFGYLGIYHTLSDMARFGDLARKERYFSLRKLPSQSQFLECSMRQDSAIPQSDEIVFITIGYLIYHRAFREYLLQIASTLKQEKVKFILVGRSETSVWGGVANVNFYCNPSIKELSLLIKQAHFVFGLYDSFAHRHYLGDSTSGLRQIALSYNLPFVINAPFAKAFGFSKNNAIIYHAPLVGIKYAISIAKSAKYIELKENLARLREKLIQDSLHNLKTAIKRIKEES